MFGWRACGESWGNAENPGADALLRRDIKVVAKASESRSI